MRLRSLLLLALAAALFGATVLTGQRVAVQDERPYDVDLVPRASALRWLSLGHHTLVANLYWLRTVQYIGDPRGDRRGWDKLFPLADLVTDLDPRHGYAYQVTGNVLGGVGRVEESNRILEKGTRNNPDRYILPFHRAVNAFLYAGDYAEAGRWFEKAAQTPGAPAHLRESVVAFYVKGNQADAAIGFLEHLRASASDPESRKAIQKQLERASVERVALGIDEAVDRYRQRFLVGPLDLQRLVDEGILPVLPPDPLGGSWYLGEDERVHSTANPQRYQRPESDIQRRQAATTLGRQMSTPPTP